MKAGGRGFDGVPPEQPFFYGNKIEGLSSSIIQIKNYYISELLK